MKTLVLALMTVSTLTSWVKVENTNITSIYQGCEKFNSEFYYQLVEESAISNKICVPVFPLYTLLALLRHGTEDDVEALFTNYISLPSNKLATATQTQDVLKQLESDFELHISNAVFINCNYKFKHRFKKIALLYYNTTLSSVNFTDLKTAANFINDVHSTQTEGNVEDVIDVSDLDENIEVIFGSASYYEVFFRYSFNKIYTKQRRFYEDKYRSTLITFMELRGVVFNVTKSDQELISSILEVPLANPSFVGVFILPISRIFGVEYVNGVIASDSEVIARAVYNLKEEVVSVSIPKMRIEYGNSKVLARNLAENYSFLQDNPGNFNLLINYKTIILMTNEDGIFKNVDQIINTSHEHLKLNRPFIFLIYNKQYNFTMFRATFYGPFDKIYQQECDARN